MALFFISYDLSNADEDEYQELWGKLESLGAIRIQESLWALKSNSTAKNLRDKLVEHLSDGDRLMVIKSEDWADLDSMTNPNNLN